jgi:GTP cyclohydrolase I
MNDDTARIAEAWATILLALGYDNNDAHLKETPQRVARFLTTWHTTNGDPPKLTCFPNEPKVDEIVAVGGIRFYSMCAHHGLPFGGRVAIGYIPNGKVVGLSKFARVVDYFAHRFQVQERLTHEIAAFLEKELEPIGVGVVVRAEHLCMSMRGVERPSHMTITSDMRGAFRQKPEARAELLTLLDQGAPLR